MVRGENYDEVEYGSIKSHLISLLLQLITDTSKKGFIYASSAQTKLFTSAPSNLYTVEISPGGQDFNIMKIQTEQGQEPVITDIAKEKSGGLWRVSDGILYRIDEKTALAERIGESDFNQINALELDKHGRLLGLTVHGELIHIDKKTGSGQLFSKLQGGWESVGDIAFGPKGNLFGIVGKRVRSKLFSNY